jgi:hypothetical protein
MQEQTSQIMRAVESVTNRIDGLTERMDCVFEQKTTRARGRAVTRQGGNKLARTRNDCKTRLCRFSKCAYEFALWMVSDRLWECVCDP